MDQKTVNNPSDKLPNKIDMAALLIKAEIKNHILLSGLNNLGFDTTPYVIDFSHFVLLIIGFREFNNDLLQLYNDVLDRHCKNIDVWKFGNKVDEEVAKIIDELIIEKRKRDKEN